VIKCRSMGMLFAAGMQSRYLSSLNQGIRRLFVPKKKTTAHRSPWSKEDVKELKAHSKARTPVAKIAKTMKRTEGALRRKAGILGIGLGHDR
jgi:hypothetical protein